MYAQRSRFRNRTTISKAAGISAVENLDDFMAGMVVAYSPARKLLTSYAGPALRLRRNSDDAESDFGFDASGLVDSIAIASWTGGGNAFVTKLYDQSGNGRHAVQSTASNQPRFVAAEPTLDNKPAMDFDGSNDGLLFQNAEVAALSTTLLAIQVLSRDVSGGFSRSLSFQTLGAGDYQTNSAFAMEPGNQGSNSVVERALVSAACPTVNNSVGFFFSCRIQGANFWAGVNGLESPTAVAGSTLMNLYQIGLGYRPSGAEGFNGKIGDVCVWSPSSVDQLNPSINRLQRFWNITV